MLLPDKHAALHCASCTLVARIPCENKQVDPGSVIGFGSHSNEAFLYCMGGSERTPLSQSHKLNSFTNVFICSLKQ